LPDLWDEGDISRDVTKTYTVRSIHEKSRQGIPTDSKAIISFLFYDVKDRRGHYVRSRLYPCQNREGAGEIQVFGVVDLKVIIYPVEFQSPTISPFYPLRLAGVIHAFWGGGAEGNIVPLA
jgi:hypothetical protein